MSEDQFKFFLKIKDLTNYEKRKIFIERPRLTGLYNVNYEDFFPSDTIMYHFKSQDQIVYPLDLNGTSEFFLKHRTQEQFFHTLMHTMLGGTSMFAEEKEDHAADIELTNVYSREPETEEEFDCRKVFYYHMRLAELVFEASDSCDQDGRKHYDDNIFQVLTHQTSIGRFKLHYVCRTQGIIADRRDCLKINNLQTLNRQRFVAVKQLWAKMKDNELRLLKFWLQGYLSNIKDLYIAYKDSDGVVREPMEHIHLRDIPKKCSWKPHVCTAFLLDILNKIERLMDTVDSLETVYRFSFNAKHKTVFYKIYEGKSQYSFIPNDYADFIQGRFL
ncbi:uncharacterized protein LOC142222207 isoform X2 [Haematobia irritans]|uniref:uncharacterized protein LOC142222207 isoform X2 n=1 Tax=Haematobia irritans TaxID=7368 RepID=UPI003F500A4D